MSQDGTPTQLAEAGTPWKRRIILGLIGVVLLVCGKTEPEH